MTAPISKNKEKVIKYDKDLLQRFLVVSRSREIDLQDVLSYELSPVPLSIAHLKGSTRKTAKSNLLKELIIDINIPDHLPIMIPLQPYILLILWYVSGRHREEKVKHLEI